MPRPDLTDKVMPFGEHLDELRRRLLFALVGVLPIFVVALAFGQTVLVFLLRPIQHSLAAAGQSSNLQATGPLETFMTYIQTALVLTIIVGSPWILYQLWRFVAPGLYAQERRFAYLLAPLSVSLTMIGVVFLYVVILPVTLGFLIHFGANLSHQTVAEAPLPEGVTLPIIPLLDADPKDPPPGAYWINRKLKEERFAVTGEDGNITILQHPLTSGAVIAQQYRVSEYVDLLLALALAFAIAFQTPVVVLLLGWAGLVDLKFLAKYRRHAIFGCAVVAAIVAPSGDPLTMTLLTVPLYLLYELGILLLRLLPASRVAGGFSRADKRAGKMEPDGEPGESLGAP